MAKEEWIAASLPRLAMTLHADMRPACRDALRQGMARIANAALIRDRCYMLNGILDRTIAQSPESSDAPCSAQSVVCADHEPCRRRAETGQIVPLSARPR